MTIKTKTLKRKSNRKKPQATEADSRYILKLALYLIVGSLWLKITPANGGQIPIPVGFMIGALFAMRDSFQLDRKIEYALLLVAMFIGFWLPIGIFITI